MKYLLWFIGCVLTLDLLADVIPREWDRFQIHGDLNKFGMSYWEMIQLGFYVFIMYLGDILDKKDQLIEAIKGGDE